MPINEHFNLYNATNEQDLLENLIIESIKIYGFNTYYMPRQLDDFDDVFREATASSYNEAFLMEVYLKSNLQFTGDGKFMSRELGLEIRDQTTFTVAQRVFEDITEMARPREGDLVYLPLDKKVYEIKYVSHQAIFYQMGKLMVYDLDLELLEYAGEQFNTGIAEIDSISTTFNMDETEDNTIEDWIDQSTEFQAETNDVIDFTESDPFSLGNDL